MISLHFDDADILRDTSEAGRWASHRAIVLIDARHARPCAEGDSEPLTEFNAAGLASYLANYIGDPESMGQTFSEVQLFRFCIIRRA
jgi:hypothetical protein